jgi:RNA polymerase sigma-70 factor (ECF subfamily)
MQHVRGDLASRDFDVWYPAARPRLIVAVGGMGASRTQAEEVVDEALELAWRNWAELRTMAAPQGWAYRAAVNVWNNRRRRLGVERRLFRRSPDGSADVPTVDDPHIEFQALISGLSRKHQQVLVMRYALMMTEPEIARTIGIPRGTVASRLHHAHARLRDLLSHRDARPVVAEWGWA